MAVALGSRHTVALDVPAQVTRTEDALRPRPAHLLIFLVLAMAAGSKHSLALCSDGTVAGWGAGAMTGDGTNEERSLPVAVDASGALAGKRVVKIAAGENHSLVLCADGTLVAWGKNDFGQLGDGGNLDSPVPVRVDPDGLLDGKTILGIAAGGNFNLVLCSDGTLEIGRAHV